MKIIELDDFALWELLYKIFPEHENHHKLPRRLSRVPKSLYRPYSFYHF